MKFRETLAVIVAVFLTWNSENLFAGRQGTWRHPKLEEPVRHTIHVKKHDRNAAPYVAPNAVPNGYGPLQIRRAYGFDSVAYKGAGQKIAIVNCYGSPTIQSDLDLFSSTYGIASTTVEIMYPQGTPASFDEVWGVETSLDVEWAHAIAPAATIMVVATQSGALGDLLDAVDYAVGQGATVVSMSWGTPEFPEQGDYEYHFAHSGVSFVAASGDSGTGVLWPAVSRHVVAVGGTTLSLDATGDLIFPETAWGGSGGGMSQFVAQPAYQTFWQATGRRIVPDVGYNADPYTGFAVYDSLSYDSGWLVVAGTSAGSPQWAALLAVVNSARSTPIGELANEALYSLSVPQQSRNLFRDIAYGCNSSTIYWDTCAHTGYDALTGVGSPRADRLVDRLIAY